MHCQKSKKTPQQNRLKCLLADIAFWCHQRMSTAVYAAIQIFHLADQRRRYTARVSTERDRCNRSVRVACGLVGIQRIEVALFRRVVCTFVGLFTPSLRSGAHDNDRFCDDHRTSSRRVDPDDCVVGHSVQQLGFGRKIWSG